MGGQRGKFKHFQTFLEDEKSNSDLRGLQKRNCCAHILQFNIKMLICLKRLVFIKHNIETKWTAKYLLITAHF